MLSSMKYAIEPNMRQSELGMETEQKYANQNQIREWTKQDEV